MNKKKPFTNWEDADQKGAFKRMCRTMDKEFGQATEDFRTVGPTQEDAFTPGRKVTMGNIDPRVAAKKLRKWRSKK